MLLEKAFANARPKSLTVLLISSLTDMAHFITSHEVIFQEKVKNVVIMGGIEPFELKAVRLVPDKAQNNSFDMAATQLLYAKCQDLGVPTTTLSRFSAYAAPVPRSIYDDMCANTTNQIAQRLREAQRSSIEKLWQRAVATTPEERQGLPGRCDKAWFCQTFCQGAGMDRKGTDTIWDLVSSFNMY